MTTTPSRQLFNPILYTYTNSQESSREDHPDESRSTCTPCAPPLTSGIIQNTTQHCYTKIENDENTSHSPQETFRQNGLNYLPIGKSIRPVPISVFSREGSSHSRQSSFVEQDPIQKKDSNGPVTPPRFSAFSDFTPNSKATENGSHHSERETIADHPASVAQRVKTKASSLLNSQKKSSIDDSSIIESLKRFEKFINSSKLPKLEMIFEGYETENSPSPARSDDQTSPLDKKRINLKEDDDDYVPPKTENQLQKEISVYTPKSQGSETPWIGKNEPLSRSSVSTSYSLPRAEENANIQNEKSTLSSATTPCILTRRHHENEINQSSRKLKKREEDDSKKTIASTPLLTPQLDNVSTFDIENDDFDPDTWEDQYKVYLSKYKTKNRGPDTPAIGKGTPLMSSPLPRLDETGNFNDNERVYRHPSDKIPGIILDSHQRKHVSGLLFGAKKGGRGDRFYDFDSTENGLKTILDYLFSLQELEFMNFYPSEDVRDTRLQIDLNGRGIPQYKEIQISSITYIKELKSWCFHLFPVLGKSNT